MPKVARATLGIGKWAQQDLNLRPSDYESGKVSFPEFSDVALCVLPLGFLVISKCPSFSLFCLVLWPLYQKCTKSQALCRQPLVKAGTSAAFIVAKKRRPPKEPPLLGANVPSNANASVDTETSSHLTPLQGEHTVAEETQPLEQVMWKQADLPPVLISTVNEATPGSH